MTIRQLRAEACAAGVRIEWKAPLALAMFFAGLWLFAGMTPR